MRIYQKGIILTVVPFILAAGVVGTLSVLIWQTNTEAIKDFHYRKLAEHTSKSMLLMFDAGYSLHRAVLDSDHPEWKKRFKRDIQAVHAEQDEMQRLGDELHIHFERFESMMQTSLGALKDIIDALRSKKSFLQSLVGLPKLQDEFAQQVYDMCEEGQAFTRQVIIDLKQAPMRDKKAFDRQCQILLAAVFGGLGVAIALARWYSADITNRLKVIIDNTLRLSRDAELHPLVHGNDEIAEVDRSFHAMADALSAARARERALFENAQDMICIFDGELNFVSINPAGEHLLQKPADQLAGTSLIEFLAESDREKTINFVEQLKNETRANELETRIITAMGDAYDMQWSLYWSYMDQALYAVAHDMTEQKEIDRAKQEFLAMVSHDLRSPLTGIVGSLKLLAANALGQLPETPAAKINDALVSSNRLLDLINDLLDIEKLEAGEMKLEIAQANIKSLLERSAQEVDILASAAQVRISVQADEFDFPIDVDRVHQVLINLLSNAIKFSEPNTEIALAAVKSEGTLHLTVSDQGRGIPLHLQATVFDKYKQVTAADGRRSKGTGLGLAICKEIVNAHAGTITVSSEEGVGTTFSIELPEERSKRRLAKPGEISSQNYDIFESSRAMAVVAELPKKPSMLSRITAPFNNARFAQKGLVLIALPLAFELTFASILFHNFQTAFHDKQIETRNRLIATTSFQMLIQHYEAGSAMSIPDPKKAWTAFETAVRNKEQTEKDLMALVADVHPAHEILVDILKRMKPANEFIEEAEKKVKAAGVSSESLGSAFSNRNKLEEIASAAVSKFDDVGPDAELTHTENIEQKQTTAQTGMLWSGLAVSGFICILSAMLFGEGVSQRLRTVEENARRLVRQDPLNPECGGKDEVGQLDHFFHVMEKSLRESKRKEKAVFDNAQDVFCSLDRQGEVTRINPACLNAFKLLPSNLVGCPLRIAIATEDQQAFDEALNTVSVKQTTRSVETNTVGNTIVSWSLSWSDKEGLVVAIGHDITKRKQLEQLKQEFLAMVSHDLRTPLTSLDALVDMLLMGVYGELPTKAREQMERVQRACNRLIGLVNDLLDLEKLQSGNMQLEIAVVHANDVVHPAIDAVASLAEAKKITLRGEVAEGMASISADSSRLVQVCINLLSNAVKFSPEGATVVLQAVPADRAVEFQVCDEGRGVPEQFKAIIFEKYKQAAAADGRRAAQGTGLGLPICKQIVLQHGGEIGVENNQDKGSTFWFRIPALEEATIKTNKG